MANHSDWMKNLPKALHSVPLNQLAIPGTSMFVLVTVIKHSFLNSATFTVTQHYTGSWCLWLFGACLLPRPEIHHWHCLYWVHEAWDLFSGQWKEKKTSCVLL